MSELDLVQAARPQIAVRLTITMYANGQVNVDSGSMPLTNRVMLYGLMEMAKDAIQEACKTVENKVQPVSLFPQV